MNELTRLKILLNKALQEIKELKEENKRLRKRIEELEGKQQTKEVPSFVKPDRKAKSHKLGSPKGHQGFSRPLPDHVE
jgi:regulator of replication initiation timing